MYLSNNAFSSAIICKLLPTGDYNRYNSSFALAEGGGPVLVDVSLSGNLIDIIWSTDTENPQPMYPDEKLQILDAEKYTGMFHKFLVLFLFFYVTFVKVIIPNNECFRVTLPYYLSENIM